MGTGNAGKVTRCGGGVASPTQRKMSLAQFASRGRWAPRPVFTGRKFTLPRLLNSEQFH